MRTLALGVLMVIACDPGRTPVGVDAPPSALEECQAIYDHVRALIASADRTCSTASDCGRFGGSGTCNCATFLGEVCNGDPMSRAGVDAVIAGAGAELDRYRALGCSLGPQVCDCGPGTVDCVAGRCDLVGEQSCFLDAGVDAP
jgi:hypothetical protein